MTATTSASPAAAPGSTGAVGRLRWAIHDGLVVPNTEVANTAGFIWLFPLTFLSNAFVPLQGMPAWLQTIAIWNPVSSVVAAARKLFGNPNPFVGNSFPERHSILMSIVWIAVILAVFVPLAIRRYRLTTSR